MNALQKGSRFEWGSSGPDGEWRVETGIPGMSSSCVLRIVLCVCDASNLRELLFACRHAGYLLSFFSGVACRIETLGLRV